MVELRKRKAPAEAAPPPPAKKNSNPVKKAVEAAKSAVLGNSASSDGAVNGSAKLAVGQTIALEGFGGELETHTGEKVTLQRLLEQSQAGVVLFTYPKANTPGCKSTLVQTTNQHCQSTLMV
jgi:thioredoxin-dependent peroxiredoxin